MSCPFVAGINLLLIWGYEAAPAPQGWRIEPRPPFAVFCGTRRMATRCLTESFLKYAESASAGIPARSARRLQSCRVRPIFQVRRSLCPPRLFQQSIPLWASRKLFGLFANVLGPSREPVL